MCCTYNENFEKISTTQLKPRLNAFNANRRSAPMQYIPEHGTKKEPTTHRTHTYKDSSHF